MPLSQFEYLRHILEEIDYIQEDIEGLSREEFMRNKTLKRSFVRSLEIIGEATKKLSKDFRDVHQEIEWRGMAGMRDRLIHAYFAVDYDLVWDVVKNKLPTLKGHMERILTEDDTDREPGPPSPS